MLSPQKHHWCHNSCPTLVNRPELEVAHTKTAKSPFHRIVSGLRCAWSHHLDGPRPEHRRRHNLHHNLLPISTFTSFSCLSAASRRVGSIVPRRASTKASGSMIKKNSSRLGFSDFRRVSVLRRCAHGCTALRLPGAKGSSGWSTRIDQRQIWQTRTSGDSCYKWEL